MSFLRPASRPASPPKAFLSSLCPVGQDSHIHRLMSSTSLYLDLFLVPFLPLCQESVLLYHDAQPNGDFEMGAPFVFSGALPYNNH